MRVVRVVLFQSAVDSADEVVAAVEDRVAEIAPAECTEGELGLVQPGGVRRREVWPNSVLMLVEPSGGLLRGVRRGVVEDKFDPLGVIQRMINALERLDEVVAVVARDHATVELARRDDQAKAEVRDAIPHVLELAEALSLRTWQDVRCVSADGLDAGLLVDADNEDSLAGERLRALVVPENRRGLSLELRVLAPLPVARSVRTELCPCRTRQTVL